MIFQKKVDEKLFLRLKKTYAALLRRKDDEIEQLKKENEILMKTAFKQSENAAKWRENTQKLEERLKKKKTKKKK